MWFGRRIDSDFQAEIDAHIVRQHVAGLGLARIGEGFLGRSGKLFFHQVETDEKVGSCLGANQQVWPGGLPNQFLEARRGAVESGAEW